MNDISLDKEFESFLKEEYPDKTHDLTKVDDKRGAYKDSNVSLMYSAFKRSYKDARKFFLKSVKKSRVNLVARSEKGKLKFSDSIFVHHDVDDAKVEAERLSEKYKTKFHVFSKVSTHEYKPK